MSSPFLKARMHVSDKDRIAFALIAGGCEHQRHPPGTNFASGFVLDRLMERDMAPGAIFLNRRKPGHGHHEAQRASSTPRLPGQCTRQAFR